MIFQIAFLCALIAIGSFRAKECRCVFAFPHQDKLSPSSQFVSLFACVVLKMLKILQVNLNSPLISERDVALSVCGCAMHELICINKSYRYFCQLVFFAVAPPSLRTHSLDKFGALIYGRALPRKTYGGTHHEQTSNVFDFASRTKFCSRLH